MPTALTTTASNASGPLVGIPIFGWIVIAFVALLIFILLMSKGAKLMFGNKTVELDSGNGEKYNLDLLGLTYVMSDECHQIEQRKKEAIDDIVPDLSYKLTVISNLTCINLRAESILNSRRRRNGFETLLTKEAIDNYINSVSDELLIKLNSEIKNTVVCAINKADDIKKEDIFNIASIFTIKAIQACEKEYQQKIDLYNKFLPLYKSINDKNRIAFCEAKIKKHTDRITKLSSILESYKEV